ncbi:hypothetical protein C0995_004805 [Termitomyces sp. Mi166|nr:hypothetical protein C0995_004805 [Termitomyces sp. Mi166\
MASSAVASPSSGLASPSSGVALVSSGVVSPSSGVSLPSFAAASYAERARKAQNIRTSIAVRHEPRPPSPHPKCATVNVWSQRMAGVAPCAPSAPSCGPHDPFVVRNPGRRPPPPIDDQSWPEVGKSLQDESTPNHDPPAPGPSPRKSTPTGEKTKSKWVPIPPQELQAAADALDNQRRKSSRHHSHSGSRKPPSKPFAQGSASGSSRIPSASQSRSESLQSSPLFPRGRRLPDDKEFTQDSHPQANASRPRSPPQRLTHPPHQQQRSSSIPSSIRPSASPPHSPPLVVQPHLAPPPQPIPVYTHPNPNLFMQYAPGGTSPLAYPASPPPGTYPPVFPYPLPLQHVWYPNLGPTQHWNPNPNTNQPGSGQHSPRYPHPNVYQQQKIPQQQQHHERMNSRATWVAQHHSTSTERAGPLPPEASLPPLTVSASTPVPVNGHGTQQLPTFGSIDTARTSSPSPVPDPKPIDEDDPRPFPQFTIGVAPGEIVATRSRSRTHSQTSSLSHHSGKRSRTTTGDEKLGLAGVSENAEEEGAKIIDLTGGKAASETRWAFGTVATGQGETLVKANAAVLSSVSTTTDASEVARDQLPPQSSPEELHKRLERLALKGGEEDGSDPFEVKDYGYGFGSRGSSGDSPRTQTQMIRQKHDGSGHMSPVLGRERGEHAPRYSKRELPSRRGGYHNHNHHPNLNHGQGAGHEGRAYPPRRGRGNNHGNGYGRGGYAHRRNGSGSISGYQHQQHLHMRSPPPFSVNPPFDPVVTAGGFYPGRSMMGMGMNGIGINGMYHDGTGYQPIPMPQAAPVPAPVTQLSFPLDTTRWYLLGQLEYYLSAQNMAQDYFLRQRLDSKGWVPISLIASFNRVRHLTENEALVREVLALSSVVEVQGVWVRMKDWQAFVLPGAQPSNVEHEGEVTYDNKYSNGDQDGAVYSGKDGQSLPEEEGQEEQADTGAELDGSLDEDDEDEDDVVFVLTRDEDAKIPWPTEKRD